MEMQNKFNQEVDPVVEVRGELKDEEEKEKEINLLSLDKTVECKFCT